MFESVDTLERDLLQFAGEGFQLSGPFKLPAGSSAVGKALIQLAAGKSVDALGGGREREPRVAQAVALREAATRFVSDIMLATSSNYFTTLGVSTDAEPGEIRDNFRRLMALVHPDAQPVGFPADAASRVNRAYAVLSESASRAAYAARELGVSPFDAVILSGEPTPRRSAATASEANDSKSSGRIFMWLQALRARQSLLWVAAVLLLPFGAAVTSFFSYEAPRQLVEAQPKADLPAATPPSAPSAPRSVDAAAAPIGAAVARVTTAADTMRDAPVRSTPLKAAAGASVADTNPAQNSSLAPATQLKYSSELEQNVPITSTPAATAPRRPAPTAIADVPAVAIARPTSSLAPVEPTRVTAADVAPISAVPLLANAAAQTALSQRLATSDAEAMVIRFSNAYEAGSISAFGQLFAPAMTSKRQMLNDYERVFASTRQRNIKFNQLKHTMSGDKLSTSGYAVVTTTDQDNRVMTQRVFLEFEISRDRGEPRIERLANYVIN